MTADIQRQINRNVTASIPTAISVNSTTSTTIANINTSRIFFSVSNNSNKDIWIKLQAALVDNDKKGIWLPRDSYWEMPTDNIYTGEISAIQNTGIIGEEVYITEY